MLITEKTIKDTIEMVWDKYNKIINDYPITLNIIDEITEKEYIVCQHNNTPYKTNNLSIIINGSPLHHIPLKNCYTTNFYVNNNVELKEILSGIFTYIDIYIQKYNENDDLDVLDTDYISLENL